jgi:hypothetical protein
MRYTYSLSKFSLYYTHYYFFQLVLQVEKGLDLGRLRWEVEQLCASPNLNTQDNLNYFARLFEEMSWEVPNPEWLTHDMRAEHDELIKCAMIPIRRPNSGNLIDTLVRASDDTEWFIADRSILFESFKSEAPLLALDADQISRCGKLISFLGLEDRKLSRIAVAVPTREAADDKRQAMKWAAYAQHIDR